MPGKTSHYAHHIRNMSKSKYPSVKHACDDDAAAGTLTTMPAHISREPKVHLLPLVSRRPSVVLPKGFPPLHARPLLYACAAAIWARGGAPPQSALTALASGADDLHPMTLAHAVEA